MPENSDSFIPKSPNYQGCSEYCQSEGALKIQKENDRSLRTEHRQSIPMIVDVWFRLGNFIY